MQIPLDAITEALHQKRKWPDEMDVAKKSLLICLLVIFLHRNRCSSDF